MSVHDDLKAFLDDELSPERAAEVQAAIDQDPALREEVLFMKNISGAIQSAAKEPQAAGLEAAVKRVAKPGPTFTFGRLLRYSAAGFAGVFLLGLIGMVFFPVFGQAKLAAKKTQALAESYQTADRAAASPGSVGGLPESEAKKSAVTGTLPQAGGGMAGAAPSAEEPVDGDTYARRMKGGYGDYDASKSSSEAGKAEGAAASPSTLGRAPDRSDQGRFGYKTMGGETQGQTYSNQGVTIADPNRQVIRTANVGLKVKDVGKAMEETETQVMAMGGFVENTDFNEGTDDAHGTMNFQVPEKNFNAMVENLSKTGKVVKNNKTGTDVTGQIADTTGRIRALADEEHNLIEELQQTKNSTDRWAIRGRLSNVRMEMEGLKEQNKATKNLAEMSRFAVTFEKSGQFDDAQAGDWFGQTTQGAGNVLGFFGRVFGVGLIYVLFLAPIWLPIVGIVWWLRKRAGTSAS